MVLIGYNSENMFASIDECPSCGHNNAKIVDSRFEDTFTLRIRRKECKDCGRRWNTVEMTEEDFENISSLTESRDITTLRSTVNTLTTQLQSLQMTLAKLTNVASSLDATTKQKHRDFDIITRAHL